MHSLFIRIFVLFWIAMALIVGGSIAVTFTVAAREYDSREFQRRPAVAIEASEVLGKGGLAALKKWLSSNQHSVPDRDLYIIGPDGRDILGRPLSDGASRRLEFFSRESLPDSDQSDRKRRSSGRLPAIFVRGALCRRSSDPTGTLIRCCCFRAGRASSAR